MHQRAPLLLLLLAYVLVGSLYAVYTPDWQAPDEPAHYNYVQQLASGALPVIEDDDYDEAYRDAVVSARFAPQYSIAPLTYEDWQPPLYYLLQTPLFMATGGSLLALRLLSLLLGAGVVIAAYAVGRAVWPEQQWPALLAAAFVAFLPQHVAMLAAVNNDSLAELLIGALLWLLLVRNDDGHARWWLVGLLLGLGLLTKATVYIMVPVVGLALLIRYRGRRLWQSAARAFTPALFLGGLWWARNLFVYEGFDPLGAAAHGDVVVGQARTAEWLASYGLSGTIQRFLQTTFQSFWGQFGWMGVVMDARIYGLLLVFSGLALAGFAWAIVRAINSQNSSTVGDAGATQQRIPAIVLGATLLATVALYLGYNVTFVQHQGRYLFPALIPLSLALVVGLRAWIVPLARRWPWFPTVLVPVFALGLIGLDLLALFTFIVPQLSLP
jgi:4-amino-4-deoxy-L-arabinose transferase-like glycosyltransferase